MTTEVLWRGPLFGVAGYAQEGREFVLGLDAIGVHVRAEDAPLGPHRSPLEASAERRLHELTAAQIGPEATRVEHGLPARWAPGARRGISAARMKPAAPGPIHFLICMPVPPE